MGFKPIIPASIKLQNLDEIALQIFWAVSGETALQST
tara:strand:+ start:514 stop:624 length:111 start_codon:yes stop_codon:yes gene_type:complete